MQYDFTKYNKRKNKSETVGTMKLNSLTADKAELLFYGDITSDTWENWTKEDTAPQDVADFLKEIDNYKDLDIRINSGGGSVYGGLAIYSILKRHQGKKTVYIDGLAASIASVIAFAGDEIVMPSYAQLMIHKPWSGLCGNADDLRKEAETLDICQKSITDIYLSNVVDGITEETVTELINAETWLTGEEASKYFNITVDKSTDAVACCSSAYFDKYANTPEKLMKKENADNSAKERLQTQLELLCI